MYLRHYDESSECETVRQHKVAEVAWSVHPISVLELTKNEVDGGSLSRTLQHFLARP